MTGAADGEVQVRIAAPPVDGKANRELLLFLARSLDVPRSRLTLQRGAASRHKVVTVEGLDLAEVMRRLGCSHGSLPAESDHSG